MSNFDFGGSGSAPGNPPAPVGHRYSQPNAPQFQPNVPQFPSNQPANQQQGAGVPAEKPGGGGILPVGIIALVLLLGLTALFAIRGNRVWPFSSQIDSARTSLGGDADKLTDELRGRGFICTDSSLAEQTTFYRACSRFAKNEQLAIVFAGTPGGDIKAASMKYGNLAPVRAHIDAVIDLVLPGGAAQAKAAVGGSSAQGTWGSAVDQDRRVLINTPDADRILALSPVRLPGSLGQMRPKLSDLAYACDQGERTLSCTRTGGGGTWTLKIAAAEDDPTQLRSVSLEGLVQDDKQFDPAAELERVLPASGQRDAVLRYLRTADQYRGMAGYTRGSGVYYSVAGNPDQKTRSAAVVTIN